MRLPPPPTPSAENIWFVKSGAAAPQAERAIVLAAIAEAAYLWAMMLVTLISLPCSQGIAEVGFRSDQLTLDKRPPDN